MNAVYFLAAWCVVALVMGLILGRAIDRGHEDE